MRVIRANCRCESRRQRGCALRAPVANELEVLYMRVIRANCRCESRRQRGCALRAPVANELEGKRKREDHTLWLMPGFMNSAFPHREIGALGLAALKAATSGPRLFVRSIMRTYRAGSLDEMRSRAVGNARTGSSAALFVRAAQTSSISQAASTHGGIPEVMKGWVTARVVVVDMLHRMLYRMGTLDFG